VGDDRLMVSEGAGKALFNLLSNSGTLRGRTLDQVHARLIEVVNRLWEGGKVSSFIDSNGGGWFINISRGFGDVMLYAVVRSVDGNRGVVDVIDEAELDVMKKAPTNPQEDGSSESVMVETFSPKAPQRVPEPQGASPESPVLLRWISERGDGMNKRPKYDEEELKYVSVSERVQALLRDGIDPRDIEIWTHRKKPQVKVELV
jgi:hypothetical protein